MDFDMTLILVERLPVHSWFIIAIGGDHQPRIIHHEIVYDSLIYHQVSQYFSHYSSLFEQNARDLRQSKVSLAFLVDPHMSPQVVSQVVSQVLWFHGPQLPVVPGVFGFPGGRPVGLLRRAHRGLEPTHLGVLGCRPRNSRAVRWGDSWGA